MKVFHSLEEMQPYYDEEINTYKFVENGERLDVKFCFTVKTRKNIYAWDIIVDKITALKLVSYDLIAFGIDVRSMFLMNRGEKYAKCVYQRI